jgi:uncharacterized protein (DUF58 family)
MIAVDSSGSMAFASEGNISKFEYGIYLAAALTYMLINQRDSIGLTLYNDEIRTFLPPHSKQSYIHQILKALASTVPSNTTGTAHSLDTLAERIKRRGLVVIISDFFDDVDSIISALRHFRHKQHEVLVFHTLDPREIDFKFGNAAVFKDMETDEEIVTLPYQMQRSYSKAVKGFIDKIKKECLNHNIDYNLIDTSQSFDKALRSYLTKRQKMYR